MSPPIARNPSRFDLLRLAEPSATVRAIRDPVTGDCFAWPADAARHAEVAMRLGLESRTRQDIQRHGFVIGREQIEAIEANDMAGVIRSIEG